MRNQTCATDVDETTELLQKVYHRKGRDSALRRLPSAAFPGITFSSNLVDLETICIPHPCGIIEVAIVLGVERAITRHGPRIGHREAG